MVGVYALVANVSGLAKRPLYLDLSEHGFRRSHQHLSRQERTEAIKTMMSVFWLRGASGMKTLTTDPNPGCLGACAPFAIWAFLVGLVPKTCPLPVRMRSHHGVSDKEKPRFGARIGADVVLR